MELAVVLFAVGLGVFSLTILLAGLYKSKKDPIDNFNRAFARRQLVAVHSPDGKVLFKQYPQDHALSELQTNVADHSAQLFNNTKIFHVYENTVNNLETPQSPSNIMTLRSGHTITNGQTVTKKTEPVATEPEKEIVVHKPGDRFLDIVGE